MGRAPEASVLTNALGDVGAHEASHVQLLRPSGFLGSEISRTARGGQQGEDVEMGVPCAVSAVGEASSKSRFSGPLLSWACAWERLEVYLLWRCFPKAVREKNVFSLYPVFHCF